MRDAYSEYNTDIIFWMEQQREYGLRHPSYQVKNDPDESLKFNKAKANWHEAPAVIVVLAMDGDNGEPCKALILSAANNPI